MNRVLASKANPPKQKTTQKITKGALVAIREYFAGPLPHPNILGKYEQIQKGAANRIIKMAEKQSSHRQDIEKKVIQSNVWNERIGMVFAFIITLSIVVGGVFLIYSDKEGYGFATIVGAFALHFYNFYKSQKKEEKVKEKAREKENR